MGDQARGGAGAKQMKRVLAILLIVMGPVIAAVPRAIAPAVAGADVKPQRDTRACVVVFSRSIAGTSCGNGFVIGDGTLIVTARHLVFPQRPGGGLHQGDAF